MCKDPGGRGGSDSPGLGLERVDSGSVWPTHRVGRAAFQPSHPAKIGTRPGRESETHSEVGFQRPIVCRQP